MRRRGDTASPVRANFMLPRQMARSGQGFTRPVRTPQATAAAHEERPGLRRMLGRCRCIVLAQNEPLGDGRVVVPGTRPAHAPAAPSERSPMQPQDWATKATKGRQEASVPGTVRLRRPGPMTSSVTGREMPGIPRSVAISGGNVAHIWNHKRSWPPSVKSGTARSCTQGGGGWEIRTPEGLPPARFPTMLASVHRGSRSSVTCPNMTGAVAGARR
jgi:hypothetical protein